MHTVAAVPAEVQLCLESAPLADTDTTLGTNTQHHRIYKAKCTEKTLACVCVCVAGEGEGEVKTQVYFSHL